MKPRRSWPRRIVIGALVPIFVLALAIGLGIGFGGPATPAPMGSINAPFRSVDLSALPPLSRYAGADGASLAYRSYQPVGAPAGSVTLVHGSSASGISMHPLARALVQAGYRVHVLDLRGHGESGQRGHIAHVGQLDEDLDAFVRHARPPSPSLLAGFSAGGGFVLRIAGGERQRLFDGYLLLAPFLSQDAPNYRPDAGGWVTVGIPRIIGISMLNGIGIQAFNHLPVTAFALEASARPLLTPSYDFNLATNFRPRLDYVADLRGATRPMAVVAGADDEAFDSSQLEPAIRAAGRDWPVTLVAGIGHVPLILEHAALEAITGTVRSLAERAAVVAPARRAP